MAVSTARSDVVIYAMVDGQKCVLGWGDKGSNGLDGVHRNAKWDCSGRTIPLMKSTGWHPVTGGRLYAMAHGERCGLEWDGSTGTGDVGHSERNAKWDCTAPGNNADPVFVQNGKIYATADGSKCGLE